MQDEILRKHLLRDIDERHVRTHGVAIFVGRPIIRWFGGHARPITHEWVIDINVYRRTVALRLPVARHGNLAPTADVVVLLIKVRRPLLWIPTPMEQPLSVETHNLLTLFPFRRQLQRRMARQLVDTEHCGILPVSRLCRSTKSHEPKAKS